MKVTRIPFSLMLGAVMIASCSEKQQNPTDVQATNRQLSVYDFSTAPMSAFELPDAGPEVTIARSVSLAAVELVNNGDFTAGFTGWTTNNVGSGSWILNNGGTVSGFPVPAAPSAPQAAMTQQSGGGRHILYQDVVLPAQLCTPAQLSFSLFLGNRAGAFITNPTLNPFSGANQQFRMDIMDPSAPLDDVGAGVLQNVYQTQPGNPLIDGYKTVSATLSAGGGSTIRLRFVEVDNQFFFQAGIDNVSVTVNPDVSAPSIGLNVSPATIWPPNHAMVKVASGVMATDDCDAAPTVTIAVTSNEPINGPGDGNTDADWQVVSNPAGGFDVYVRAERSGKGSGRVYTISVTATDAFGNSSTASGTVTVPHSQK